MKHLNKSLVILFWAFFALTLQGASSGDDSVSYEVLMNSKFLSDLHLNINFTGALEITAKNQILVSSDNQLYLLGLGNMVSLGNKTNPSVGSFAFTPDSLLMIIRNNELCYMDSIGNLSLLFKLPNSGMGISAGKLMMYLYDRISTQKKYALYILQPGGQYIKLLEVPRPIYSVTESGNSLFLSVENMLMKFDLTTKELKALATIPSGENIKSVVVNPATGRVFFSSDNRFYVLGDSKIIAISDKFGGTLLYSNGLIIFNPEKKLMVRVAGSDAALVAEAEPKVIAPAAAPVQAQAEPNTPAAIEKPADALTNQNVMDMVKNQLSDDLVINIINHSRVNFNLSVDSMVELANQQVSSKVIMAMKQAMKNQGSANK